VPVNYAGINVRAVCYALSVDTGSVEWTLANSDYEADGYDFTNY